MSVQMLESFDGVTNFAHIAGTNRRWFSAADMTFTASGRTGQAVQATDHSAQMTLDNFWIQGFNASTVNDEVVLGFGFRGATGGSRRGIIGFTTTTLTGTAFTQVHLVVSSPGVIEFRRSTSTSAASLVASSPDNTLSNLTWHYIEWRLKIHGTTGICQVRVDGVMVINFTGNTLHTTTSTGSPLLRLGNQSGNANTSWTTLGNRWDDLYVVRPDGSGHDGFLGETSIPCLRPDDNGAFSEWLGSDGNSTDNYQLVDEANLNDADYVESTNDGDRDTYEHEDLVIPAGHAIASVQVNARAATLDLDDLKKLKLAARLDDGTYDSKLTNTGNLGAALNTRWANFEEKPGGGAWSEADFNDAQFGTEQAPF